MTISLIETLKETVNKESLADFTDEDINKAVALLGIVVRRAGLSSNINNQKVYEYLEKFESLI